jgi:hypothetical protein
LTSGLKLCLDAGDANSYSSGQSWRDTSGNGYDFFRGATGSAAGDDPTFNGTAGQRSSGEYWSFDGGDFFRYDTTNEIWMNNIHKNNAKFTILSWVYLPSLTTDNLLFSTQYIADTSTGTAYYLNSTEKLVFIVRNGTSDVINVTATVAGTIGTWNFMAVSLDESVGANGGFFYTNRSVDLFTSTYTSPSASSAAYTAEICGSLGTSTLQNTGRLGMFAVWEGVTLTQEQLNALYIHTRGRYGV